jgi:opacity protein-like surface antigen
MSFRFRSSVLILAAAALGSAAPASAQGFGVGVRIATIRGDVNVDPAATAKRFTGGQVRARVSPRTGVEVSLDMRSETNDAGTQRVKDYPLQASLLLFPISSTFSPFVLGGAGWYTHKLESLSNGTVTSSESTRKMGWHAGFGAELLIGRHAGVHGDYRYTFLHFGDKSDGGVLGGLRPSYGGSMWTAGLTFYF